jgi:hypothetical protein
MARGRSKAGEAKSVNGNGANLGFEAQLFLAADKLRKNLEPSDYFITAIPNRYNTSTSYNSGGAMDYRYGSHTVDNIEYHFVWITKYRYKVLTGDVALRVREMVQEYLAHHFEPDRPDNFRTES